MTATRVSGSSDVPHHAVPHSTAFYVTNTPALSPSRSSRSAPTPYLSPLFPDPSLPLSLPLPEWVLQHHPDKRERVQYDFTTLCPFFRTEDDRVVAHPWNKSFGHIFDGEFYPYDPPDGPPPIRYPSGPST
ncbi:hypothetical protein B0H13DRAFT_2380878 [Mycena leptocephala]|nr:hypothetical protein B0H13DRAFT_2380878 [Mycena leptocephala]